MKNNYLLAIDTSTDACSAALWNAGHVLDRFIIAPHEHGQHILPMIGDLLAEAQLSLSQLTAIAFGRGPGSFTGVRIAAGVVQGLAFAHDLPVMPISTLQALAQGAYRLWQAPQVLSAIDARMQEVYWSSYRVDEHHLMRATQEEHVSPASQITLPNTDAWQGVGNGCLAYQAIVQQALGSIPLSFASEPIYPHAHDIAQLAIEDWRNGKAVSAELALPIYLRDTVAWKKN